MCLYIIHIYVYDTAILCSRCYYRPKVANEETERYVICQRFLDSLDLEGSSSLCSHAFHFHYPFIVKSNSVLYKSICSRHGSVAGTNECMVFKLLHCVFILHCSLLTLQGILNSLLRVFDIMLVFEKKCFLIR